MDTLRQGCIVGAIALLAGLACSDGTGPGGSKTIAAAAGNNQSGTVGTALQPYQVLVKSGGEPATGVAVSWAVVLGGGSVTASSTTDANGVAEAVATLGTAAGPQTVRATLNGYAGSPVSFTSTGVAGPAQSMTKSAGDLQNVTISQAARQPLAVLLTDQYGNPVSGVPVSWAVTSGGGSVAASGSTSGADGLATMAFVAGPAAGANTVAATFGTQTVTFTVMGRLAFAVASGGNNVPERFTSDLWVADGYGYTGTWGFRTEQGNAVKIWKLSAQGAPVLTDSILTPNIGTVSDIEVSPDGKWLVFTGENGNGGIFVYELTSPGTPVFRASSVVGPGLHTGSLAVINGTLYAFTARNPSSQSLPPALVIYDLSQAASGTITQVATVAVPPNYGIHDTFVRNGIAFVFAWNTGVIIYDVGNGIKGGSVQNPVEISRYATSGGEVHNGWWFWNPGTGEQRYLFIGQEGPGAIGAVSSGDIHVVDVSNLAAPREVAFYHLTGAGSHNFWMDEPNQTLYAAYYNGGVVALDVSGTLSGDLSSREIGRIQPGGAGNTYVWGVHLYNGSLYASDMLSGFWQLTPP